MAITSAVIVSRGNSYRVNPRCIQRREGWNPRSIREISISAPDIVELAGEIDALDMLMPIRVKKTGPAEFQLIDGERRLTAVEYLMTSPEGALKWEAMGVPVVVVDSKQDDKTSLLQALAANRSEQLLPLEEADAFRRLKTEFGMTNDDVAKATGRSIMTINAGLALLEAPAELQSAVATGKVKADLGRKIAVATRGNKEKAKEITKAAVAAGKDKAKRKAVVAKVAEATREKAAAKGKELTVKPLDAETLNTLGAKVAKQLAELCKELGVNAEALAAQVSGDNKLAAVYSLGALDALKKAAGLKVSLTV